MWGPNNIGIPGDSGQVGILRLAKIDYLGAASFINQDICGLQISMDDSINVIGINRRDDLPKLDDRLAEG
jgi:hypothetical protein